jgi:hypothetical protein
MLRNPFEIESSERMDGALYNATTGMGVPGRDASLDYMPNVYTSRRFGTKHELERMHSESWLLQKVCAAYPASGIRRWIDITIDYEDEDFEAELEDVPPEKRTKKLEQLRAKRRRKEMRALYEYIKRLKVKEQLRVSFIVWLFISVVGLILALPAFRVVKSSYMEPKKIMLKEDSHCPNQESSISGLSLYLTSVFGAVEAALIYVMPAYLFRAMCTRFQYE